MNKHACFKFGELNCGALFRETLSVLMKTKHWFISHLKVIEGYYKAPLGLHLTEVMSDQ